MEPYKIILVDDHSLFRNGLRGLLERCAACRVVGEAASGEEFLAMLGGVDADVVFMDFARFKADGFHHLSHRAVRKDHRRHAVFFGKVERFEGEIYHFLNRVGRQHQKMEIAVTRTTRRVEIIRLRRLDTAETRTAALNVDDQCRKITAGKIRKTFALQRDSGGGAGGHNTLSCGGDADDHVDGGNFAFRLQKRSADLGHAFGHVCRDLGLRSDGITEVMTAARHDGGFGKRFVSFH